MSFEKKNLEFHVVAESGDSYLLKPQDKLGKTQRRLTPRHVSLMIIGQSVGVGLFIGVSTPLMTSGSLLLFLAFTIWALTMVWPLMLATGEMCSYLPIQGTFLQFSSRWLDPAMGFAATVIYLYTTLMFMCTEVVAFASVISYWTDASPAIFITVAIVAILFFNIFGVNWYGEVEFTASIIKVLLIVGLMFFGLITMCGGNPKGDAYGFSNWNKGGLMKSYLVEGATGRFLGFWNVLVWAAFACGGPDMLGMVSGEIMQPRKTIPSAARRTYLRIFVFYVGGIFFMNCMCASNDPVMLAAKEAGKGGAAASPWVVGIRSVGVHGLDSLVNAAIMCSCWSCANGFTYGATRSCYSASLAGYLPKIFSYCTRNGCPIVSVLLCVSISTLGYMSTSKSALTVFNWFTNLSTTGLLCTYSIMWLCYFKFRRAVASQPSDFFTDKHYKAPRVLYPWVACWACMLNFLVLFFNGFWVFFPGQFAVADLFTSYFAPVFFVCLFVFWKFWKKTQWKTALEADILTDKMEIDEEENLEKDKLEAEPKCQGKLWAVWYKVSDFLLS